jgi:toxin-antitoxin system PIN domain toxin
MFVVDTNVLIYAANEDSPFHARCRSLLDRWRAGSDAWFLSWGIIYEFLRVVTHPRVLKRPATIDLAWSFVDGLLNSPGLIVLSESSRHAEVARALIVETPGLAGNILHDARTAVLMREHGVRRIYTRDTDFHRFRFLEVVDPVVVD